MKFIKLTDTLRVELKQSYNIDMDYSYANYIVINDIYTTLDLRYSTLNSILNEHNMHKVEATLHEVATTYVNMSNLKLMEAL